MAKSLELESERAAEIQFSPVPKKDLVVGAPDGLEFVYKVEIHNRKTMDSAKFAWIQTGFESPHGVGGEIPFLSHGAIA